MTTRRVKGSRGLGLIHPTQNFKQQQTICRSAPVRTSTRRSPGTRLPDPACVGLGTTSLIFKHTLSHPHYAHTPSTQAPDGSNNTRFPAVALAPLADLNNCICMEGGHDNQHYEEDVAWMMAAGFDGVKIDNCGSSHNVSYYAELFNKTGKAIRIEVSRYGDCQEVGAGFCFVFLLFSWLFLFVCLFIWGVGLKTGPRQRVVVMLLSRCCCLGSCFPTDVSLNVNVHGVVCAVHCGMRSTWHKYMQLSPARALE